MEDDLVFAFRRLQQGEWNADGHMLPVGVLAGMEYDRRLQNGDGTVRHLEGGIVLAVAVARIVLAKPNAEHVRDIEKVLLAVEVLQIHRELDREAID